MSTPDAPRPSGPAPSQRAERADIVGAPPFVHQITPRFDDIDRAGIVYFATFYRFCHEAIEEMVAAMFDMPLEEAFRSGLWLSPIVHSEADYLHPLRLGERCRVELRVLGLSQRSITYGFCLQLADGTLCARLRLINTFVNPGFSKAVPVPPPFREGLVRLGLWAEPHCQPGPAGASCE